MSLSGKLLRAVQRAAGTTPDVVGLNARLETISAQLAAQGAMLDHLTRRFDAGDIAGFRHEFDSLAAASAEGMVYLNRTLREVRAEMIALTNAQQVQRAESSQLTQ